MAVDKDGNIFATSSTEGVFSSADAGLTWDQLNKNISDQALYSVAVNQNGEIYVGGKNAIYRSSDHGRNWSALSTGFPSKAGNVKPMVVSTQGNIIAGIDSIGVWWSTDNGSSWSQRASGFGGMKVNALISTPVGKVFAASDSGIFFLDTTSGISWTPYNDGIMIKNTLSLCRDVNGRLYCGTGWNGVYASIETFNVAFHDKVNPGGIPQASSLGSSFPNPAASSVIIPFTVTERSYVIIEIVDPVGRILNTVISGNYEPGSCSAPFDASKLSSGIYYIRMMAGKQIDIKPLIITK
ncbi:MAG: T9SS type A sorting domain-containing protein [Candidatus Kapaibacterium sp.]